MESQLQRPQEHAYDQDPQHTVLHSGVEGEGDSQHHEKKSVMKKVKAKAKKIKDTLTKHGHGQEHELEHERYYSHDDPDEEEEDEVEEMIEDPEVHGAPIYESTAIRSGITSQNVNLEKPTAVGEDRYDSPRNDMKTGTTRPVSEGKSEDNLGRPSAMETIREPEDKDISGTAAIRVPQDKDTSFPTNMHREEGVLLGRKEDENVGARGVRIDAPKGLEEDPQAPKSQPGGVPPSNYQTKVTDPTGDVAEEAGITPLLQSFKKMGVHDESVPKSETGQEGYNTGSHDQFAPEPSPTEGKSDTSPKTYDPSKPEDLPHDTLTDKSSDQSGYVKKISLAASTIADKAISAKNVVASKLGYGGAETDVNKKAADPRADENKNAAKPGTDENKNAANPSASTADYAHKVAATVTEKLAPVYGKAAGAGSSVMSKVKGSDGSENAGAEASGGNVPDKGVSVKEYWVEKLKPGEEDKALSEVIAETLHKKKEEAGRTGESRAMGKVTESEEVKRHLGTGMENKREGEDAVAAGRESSGKSVVDRFKGAVSSWMVKGGEEQQRRPQGSADGSSYVSNEGSAASDEMEHHRLQESGN